MTVEPEGMHLTYMHYVLMETSAKTPSLQAVTQTCKVLNSDMYEKNLSQSMLLQLGDRIFMNSVV